MGRKGECGGTAGGGRSGAKGNIRYTRVIPKFLQKLTDPESTKNPLDAKRPWAGHQEDHRPKDGNYDKSSEGSRHLSPKDEIEKLEAQGFKVVAKTEVDAHESKGDKKETDFGLRAVKAARGVDVNTKLPAVGGIEKRTKRTSIVTVGKAFGLKNRQKLSFAETDSEGE